MWSSLKILLESESIRILHIQQRCNFCVMITPTFFHLFFIPASISPFGVEKEYFRLLVLKPFNSGQGRDSSSSLISRMNNKTEITTNNSGDTTQNCRLSRQ